MQSIDILLFDKFSNHCLANTVEPLRAANMIAGKPLYQWRYVSLSAGQVVSSSGLPVATQLLEANDGSIDLMFLMPSYGYRAMCSPENLSALRRQSKRAGLMAGLDTGAWLLAAAGLLDGKTATIHTEVLEAFSEAFPSINVQEKRFVLDGDIITCGGAMAAFDLTMHLIATHHGEAQRMAVESLFLFHGSASSSNDLYGFKKSKMDNAALKLMDDNIENPVSISWISKKLGCTQRELQRRFHRVLGEAPGAVYRHRRLSRAKVLLSDGDVSILEIALRCGYENPSAMIRAFKKEFGLTPHAFRLAHR